MAQRTVSETAGTTSSPALPPIVAQALAPAQSSEQALSFCRKLTRSHYENFIVVSTLLPKLLRQDFCNVYAFCRTADDLGDEIHDSATALAELERLREQTRLCYAGRIETTLFTALSSTITKYEIPIDPFLDLIDAFEQDQRVTRYETFDELMNYCRRSANPVGRLVLYMCGCRDPKAQIFSDYTCSALQLANFWQDVRRDLLELDRIYIPAARMREHEITEAEMRSAMERSADRELGKTYRRDGVVIEEMDEFMGRFRELIRAEVDRTEDMFNVGDDLLPMLDPTVRGHIALFVLKAGAAILQAIREQNYDTLSSRPALSGWQKSRLLLSAVGAKLGSLNS